MAKTRKVSREARDNEQIGKLIMELKLTTKEVRGNTANSVSLRDCLAAYLEKNPEYISSLRERNPRHLRKAEGLAKNLGFNFQPEDAIAAA